MPVRVKKQQAETHPPQVSALVEARARADRLMARKVAKAKAGEPSGDVVLSYLFDRQRALGLDPHQFVTACCGRRGGKTTAVAALLLKAAKDNAKRVCLYITLTAGMAELNVWPTLKELNTLFGLGGQPRESDLTMEMPNGALVVLVGVDKQKEIEKRRGQGFALVVVDECQSIPEYLRELIDVVIAPALADVPGRLVMIGTPSLLASGYWHECHHNQNQVWGHHSWTLFDNPTLPNPKASLAAECARRGVTPEDASIQREWFARWVRDLLSAVFGFDPDKHAFSGARPEKVLDALGMLSGTLWKGLPLQTPTGAFMPAEAWRYVIGGDLGGGVARDNDAISVLAYHPLHRATWLVEEHVAPKDDVTSFCLKAKAIRDRLGPSRVSAMVVDTGGIGAKVVREMNDRHGLDVVAANKKDLWSNVEVLNAACKHGEFFAPVGSAFAAESVKVEKDWAKSTPQKIEIKGHMPDVCASVLYAYRESLSWLAKAPPEAPPPGTEEWAKQVEKKLFEKAQRDVQRERARKQDYELGDFGGPVEVDEWGEDGGEWGT